MDININKLTIEEKIGQMLIVGVEGNKVSERIKKLILDYKIGGFILYRKNFKDVKEMISLIEDLKQINSVNKIPLFIAIDQEGGRVNRLPRELLNLPASKYIAQKLGSKGTEQSSKILAEILEKSGFNMNFAPVVDLDRFKENKVIGDRSFGENIEDVSKYGLIQMNEYKKRKIIPVIKHFPGHGATPKDSHFTLPNIKYSITKLENEDMKPFEFLIKNGADCILVGHLKIKKFTSNKPCTLSRKFILKYLRKKYHYRGVIITDDLKMRAIKNRYGYKNAAIKAIKAGNDIIIFRYNKRQEEKTILTILNNVKKGKINSFKINQSVKRILKLKAKYELDMNKKLDNLDINMINERIDLIRKEVL